MARTTKQTLENRLRRFKERMENHVQRQYALEMELEKIKELAEEIGETTLNCRDYDLDISDSNFSDWMA